jgi:hypothetical protein
MESRYGRYYLKAKLRALKHTFLEMDISYGQFRGNPVKLHLDNLKRLTLHTSSDFLRKFGERTHDTPREYLLISTKLLENLEILHLYFSARWMRETATLGGTTVRLTVSTH